MSQRNEFGQMRGDSDDEPNNIDILELRNNKIPRLLVIIIYVLGAVGVVLISISFGCMLYNPVNEQEYLNNIKLQESIDNWAKKDLANQLKNFSMKLIVKSFSSERKMERIPFLTVDRHYNLTINPGYYEKVFNNNQFEFGVFDFEQFNVPLGNSADYCVQLKIMDKQRKKIYHEMKYKAVQNELQCVLDSSNNFDKIYTTGVKITPWKQTKYLCKDCVCVQGIIQNIDGKQYCFQYQILMSVCLVVQMNSDTIDYVRGCYKNNVYQVYRQAQIHEKITFEDLTLQVKEVRDPYITALSLSNNDIPIRFENANFPTIIRLLFEIGFGLLVFTIMLNLAYKANRSPSANLKRTRLNSIIYLKEQ